MAEDQNTRKPPIADLWLLVDEEQTQHYGLRRAWRWLEAEQPKPARPTSVPMPAHVPSAHPQVCCAKRQAVYTA